MSAAVGKHKDKADTVPAGDIAQAAKLKVTGTGTTLTAKGTFRLKPIPFPVPTNAEAIRPTTAGDEDKMAAGLNKIREEDPTFELRHQPQLSQTLLVTQGDMHTAHILDKLKSINGVEVERSRPRVAFLPLSKASAWVALKGRPRAPPTTTRVASPTMAGVALKTSSSELAANSSKRSPARKTTAEPSRETA